MKQNSLSFLIPDHCNMMYMLTHGLHSFWMIPIRIRDPRSLRWWHIKGTVCCTDESLPRVDSLVPFKHHDLSDLRSLTQIYTTPKECTHDLSYPSMSNKLVSRWVHQKCLLCRLQVLSQELLWLASTLTCLRSRLEFLTCIFLDNFPRYFKSIQSQHCRQKGSTWICFLSFHIWIEISH